MISKIWYKNIGSLFKIFKIDKQKIVFSNFFGQGFAGDPMYIYEALNKKDNNFTFIWMVKKEYSNIPKNIKQVKRGTLKELYHLYTAKFWVDNSRKPLGVFKRKEQFYMQTWHGNIAYKKVERGARNLNEKYILSAINDSKMIDVFLSGSEWNTEIIKKDFWYDGKILKFGLPKSDIFYNSKNYVKEEILKKYKIDYNDYIVMYCPTFRDDNLDYDYNLDFNNILKVLKTVKRRDVSILIKLHPNIINDKLSISNEKIINLSSKVDVNELLIISDLIITDYSSIMFDALEAKKDVILYTPDYIHYLGNRGVYFSNDDLPFYTCYSNEELINILKTYKNYMKPNFSNFINNLGIYNDGFASYKVAKFIEEIMNCEN